MVFTYAFTFKTISFPVYNKPATTILSSHQHCLIGVALRFLRHKNPTYLGLELSSKSLHCN